MCMSTGLVVFHAVFRVVELGMMAVNLLVVLRVWKFLRGLTFKQSSGPCV